MTYKDFNSPEEPVPPPPVPTPEEPAPLEPVPPPEEPAPLEPVPPPKDSAPLEPVPPPKDSAPLEPVPPPKDPSPLQKIEPWLKMSIAIPFIWIFFGTPFIIGVRMWNNSPIHPSFALFGAIAFAALIAFVIVITFEAVKGEILTLELGAAKFNGTTGAITLWTLVFSAVMATFIFAGFKDMAMNQNTPQPGGLFVVPQTSSSPPPSPAQSPPKSP
jgi:hypothetical protein